MKKKIIFLCTLLASSLVSNLTLSGNKFNVDENYLNQVNDRGEATSFEKGQKKKFLPDIYSYDENKECPWCGRLNRVGSNQIMCNYCGKNLYATFYTKHCPWCQYDNPVPSGTILDTCENCGCGFDSISTVSFEAFYEHNGIESPLIGNECFLCYKIFSTPFPLMVTYTDNSGKGSFILPDDFELYGEDLFVLISAGNDDVLLKTEIEPFAERHFNPNINKWTRLITFDDKSNTDYTYTKPFVYNRSKVIKGKNNSFGKAVVSLKDEYAGFGIRPFYYDSFGMLFYLGQMVMRANEYGKECVEYYWDKYGKDGYYAEHGIDPVTLIYTAMDHSSDGSRHWTYYEGSTKTIYIHRDPYSYNPDTVMHEYGHHIQRELGVSNNPGEHHCLTENHYRLGEDKGLYEAWSESWASVFSKIAQNASINIFHNNPNQELIYNLYCDKYAGSSYHGTDFESNYSTFGYYFHETGDGERVLEFHDDEGNALEADGPAEYCELTNAQILWDVFDRKNEQNFDYCTLDYYYWFIDTTWPGTYSIRDFYNGIKGRYNNFDLMFQNHCIDLTNW